MKYPAMGRDPFNQNSNRSDREKRTTSKGGPVFSQLFRLDRTDPLSFGPKFPEILVEWIAPMIFSGIKCIFGKALDNIDLNLMSHRYVSGVVKDDHFVSARSLAPRF